MDLIDTNEIFTNERDFLMESYFDKSPLILKLLFVFVAIFVIVISLNQSRKLIVSFWAFTSDAGHIFPQTFLSPILDSSNNGKFGLYMEGFFDFTFKSSFSKSWTQVLQKFKSCLRCVGDLRQWESRAMVLAENKD